MGTGSESRARYKRRRRNLFKKQLGMCFYCGEKMLLAADGNDPRRCTMEHLYPRGHPLRGANIGPATVAACFSCNHKRSKIKFNAGKSRFQCVDVTNNAKDKLENKNDPMVPNRDGSERRKRASIVLPKRPHSILDGVRLFRELTFGIWNLCRLPPQKWGK
jgi:hypothetical protein